MADRSLQLSCQISASWWRATADAGIAPATTYSTTLENSLATRSGEPQLEHGADDTDWLSLEARNGAGELLAQGAECPVIS